MRLVLKINRVSYLKISVHSVYACVSVCAPVCMCACTCAFMCLYVCVCKLVGKHVYATVCILWISENNLGLPVLRSSLFSNAHACQLYHPSHCKRPGIIIDAFAVVSNFYVGSRESKPKSLCLQSKHFM